MKHQILGLRRYVNKYLMFPTTSASISSQIVGTRLRFLDVEQVPHLKSSNVFKINSALASKSSKDIPCLHQELTNNKWTSTVQKQGQNDLFKEMKQRFLSFKKRQYLQNLEHYQNLAKVQAPKFLVIACADSRVCPSNILGFQPGDAFVVRNVANLVPPVEDGPSETKAALEFSVNTLEVSNILIVGHSCCAGISALMSMPDEANSSSFTRSWVFLAKNAKSSTMATASHHSFDLQCRHCEKESINQSMSNLLSYPWIRERVTKGVLSIHGGYYDFINCTFEKWQLDYLSTSSKEGSGRRAIRNREFWY